MPRQAQNREKRPTRVPVSGLRDILTVLNKDPEYEYRFVTDGDDFGSRILKYKRGGYELVPSDEVEVGEESVYKQRDGGSIVRIPSGNGKFLFLMKIRKEWYDEDQKGKQDQVDMIEQSMERNISPDEAEDHDLGQYGKVKVSRR